MCVSEMLDERGKTKLLKLYLDSAPDGEWVSERVRTCLALPSAALFPDYHPRVLSTSSCLPSRVYAGHQKASCSYWRDTRPATPCTMLLRFDLHPSILRSNSVPPVVNISTNRGRIVEM